MNVWKIAVVAGLAGAMAPDTAQAQTPFEAQVLAVLNAVREDPATFASKLRTFRTYFRGASYVLPGEHVINETDEGFAAVDEAIADLAARRGVGSIAPAPLLEAAAADHVAEQKRTGQVGHGGLDGSAPGDRVRQRGGGEYVAEVIEYGATDPLDVVRQLIVDDGVPDRGHRSILFDPRLRFAGVSCGPHPTYRTMCVIDLGVRSDGRENRTEFADATP